MNIVDRTNRGGNLNEKETNMNAISMTVRGKDRYKSGVMEYKKMGYWEPDYTPRTPISSLCSA